MGEQQKRSARLLLAQQDTLTIKHKTLIVFWDSSQQGAPPSLEKCRRELPEAQEKVRWQKFLVKVQTDIHQCMNFLQALASMYLYK